MAPGVAEPVNTLCTFLSLTVFIACLVLKIPQIISVFKQRSIRGLSISSVLLELCGYSIMLTYHTAMEYPLSTYLEYCVLVPQDIILLLLVLHLQGSLKVKTLPLFAVYFFTCYAIAFRIVPNVVLKIAISSVTPLSVGSKLLQIAKLLQTRDAGTVSATTWSLASYTTLTRSITTVVQTGDLAVLVNFSLSCVLNVTMTLLVIYFQGKGQKKD